MGGYAHNMLAKYMPGSRRNYGGSYGGRGGSFRNRTVRGFRGGNSLYKPYRRGGASVQRIVKRELNRRVEWKNFVITDNAHSITNTATIFSLTDVTQGSTDIQRIGDKLNATTLDLRYSFQSAASGNTVQRARVLVFQWNNDTAPTQADMILVTSGLETKAPYNTDRAAMYKIMYDKTVTMGEPATGWQLSTGLFRRKLKIPNKNMSFQAGSTTGQYKIWFLAITESSSFSPVLDLVTRLNFSDS